MSTKKDFVIENGVLKKYRGTGASVQIPDEVTEIGGSRIFRMYQTQNHQYS